MLIGDQLKLPCLHGKCLPTMMPVPDEVNAQHQKNMAEQKPAG